ncbi:MAG: branched-chain amino acid ABC transporter permease [Burkholderiaceae bacterium]
MLQILADGLIAGAIIALGAIGLSMTLSIVRFSNFSHGELLGWGAYLAFVASSTLLSTSRSFGTPIGPFSFGSGLLLGLVMSCVLTALLALALDTILFKRLRKHGAITLVIASFGAALALRNVLLFWQGGIPRYYSENLQIAINLIPRSVGGGMRVTPDQLFVLGLTLTTVTLVHLFLRRSTLGRSMRATALNPGLARVTGIDPERVLRATWLLGGMLAALGGVCAGLTVQIRPTMGVELLLPLFAAVILGGVGSIWGAVLGGFIVGLAESASVTLIGAEYRGGAAFAVLIAILLFRPTGIFGEKG